MTEIIAVRFKSGGKEYFFDPQGLRVRPGDQVIIETAKGPEFGLCSRGNTMVEDDQVVQPLRPLLRLATPKDLATLQRNQAREKEAMAVCQEKIEEHKLDMTLVRCESSFDGNKLLFFFISENRVDFRALVKSLASALHCRIELRQIGVRDESKLLGGLGICGRPYCCSSFLDQFHSVSIKMAKTQGLSLNPAKISGACGRLMCCLKYEQDAYEDAVKRLPKKDSFVEAPDGVGTILDVDMLKERVKVRLDNAPDAPQVYAADEIRVVRSGKGPRPEGYTPPSRSELEKLRKGSPRLIQGEPAGHGGISLLPLSGTEQKKPPRRGQDRPQPKEPGPAQDKGKEAPTHHRRRRGGGKPRGQG